MLLLRDLEALHPDQRTGAMVLLDQSGGREELLRRLDLISKECSLVGRLDAVGPDGFTLLGAAALRWRNERDGWSVADVKRILHCTRTFFHGDETEGTEVEMLIHEPELSAALFETLQETESFPSREGGVWERIWVISEDHPELRMHLLRASPGPVHGVRFLDLRDLGLAMESELLTSMQHRPWILEEVPKALVCDRTLAAGYSDLVERGVVEPATPPAEWIRQVLSGSLVNPAVPESVAAWCRFILA